MRIDQLHLANFRQFTKATYTFPAQFTAITGLNGSGKTTLLDALAVVLGIYVMGYGYGNSRQSPRPIMPMDIRRIPQYPALSDYRYDAVIEATGELVDKPISIRCSLEKYPFDTYTNNISDSGTQAFLALAKQLSFVPLPPVIVPLPPVITYYGSNRFNHAYDEGQFSTLDFWSSVYGRGNSFLIYDKCLTIESSIKRPQNQYRLLEKMALLAPYLQLLKQFVPKWEPDRFFADKNIREDEDVAGLYSFLDSRVFISYKMLSDGERSVLGIVSDIAFRCLMANSDIKSYEDFSKMKGVILIDDLEKSLHPEWQKRIVSQLKDAFPSIQFIISTQSPFILQSFQRDEVLNLMDPWVNTDPYRLSVEDIAESLMQVPDVQRSNLFLEMEHVAATYFQLIEEGKTSQTDEETAGLRESLNRMEDLFGYDPAFVALLRAERRSSGLDNDTNQALFS